MITIEIDHEVHSALEARAEGFNDNENKVLRRLLGLGANSENKSDQSDKSQPSAATPMVEFVRGPRFQGLGRGLDRFLAILGWLDERHGKAFEEIEKLPLGGRKYFAKTEAEIRAKAGGAITVHQIPGPSHMWALTTLSNDSKKMVVSRVLKYLGHSPEETRQVVAQFPASENRRSEERARLLAEL